MLSELVTRETDTKRPELKALYQHHALSEDRYRASAWSCGGLEKRTARRGSKIRRLGLRDS